MTEISRNILIGVTGSVAAIKLPNLVRMLRSKSAIIRIKVVTTTKAKHFFDPEKLIQEECFESSRNFAANSVNVSNSHGCASPASIEENSTSNDQLGNLNPASCGALEILDDEDEWSQWKKMGDPVLHVDLCKWADIFVIAPLDANTLGKFANGLCDNLLTCTFRAWDVEKPLIFCPAMNTRMWTHPMTSEHINKLVSWGHTEIPPISKKLACGDEGTGAMAEVTVIAEIILSKLKSLH